jgi:serine/threonine protein kinase
VAAIGHAMLAGLHHAHREALDDDGRPLHVIHRDLGLENILVANAGVVKVTDFGIARALRDAQSTLTGTVVGHSDHMAPEQANADPLDERCDLFCVGIILWELLCGRALFSRPTDAASILAVIQAPVRAPSALDPRLAHWDAFIARALARPKDERYANAREMADALAHVVDAATVDDVARFVASLPADGVDIHAAATLPIGAALGAPDTRATVSDA